MYDYSKAFRVDGKVALVSGGARGIGAEIAFALAQAGASVLVTDAGDVLQGIVHIGDLMRAKVI